VCITVRQFIFLLECWQTVSAGISRVRIVAPIVGSEVLVKTRPKFLLLVFTMLFLKKMDKTWDD